MLGFSKPKEINTEQMKWLVSEAVLDIWANPQMLPREKLESLTEYADVLNPGRATAAKFYREKLRLTTSIALILLEKSGISENDTADIIDRVKKEAEAIDHIEVRGASNSLDIKAREYAEIRVSTEPGVAGKRIELRFAHRAFGYAPAPDDVDRQYDLYKSLTTFERRAISEISTAIRESRV